ncbi:hypothetical protein JRO89_XS08G0163100 [Xanthoceras sorbifolium]|uniref:Protein kinase domain-containing protein n=1 Tax=Xanthoceras sorbifolium TaxID=99658 RepID=A0ABQ8HQ82_9ROSI|nr:hypothetical protein JRO89_XS08G0163100 [Xanthoceras sorbifolium]
MQEKRASVMAGRVYINDEEYFDFSLPESPEDHTLAPPRSTTYEADDDEEDNSFVFRIEDSVLVDPRHVMVGRMIGEGSYSVVHQGVLITLPALEFWVVLVMAKPFCGFSMINEFHDVAVWHVELRYQCSKVGGCGAGRPQEGKINYSIGFGRHSAGIFEVNFLGVNRKKLMQCYKDNPVAVKIVQPSKTSAVSREHKAKFQREVNLLARMKHENILRLVGASVEPAMIILTELVRGETLQKFLWNSRPGRLDMKVSLSLGLGISRAMEYLHANGIIHRDLKPSNQLYFCRRYLVVVVELFTDLPLFVSGNILLTEDTMEIKLADFGLAREEIMDEMTCEAGTYRWMAPELFSRDPIPNGVKKHYDHKVDVYSFAIVMWELVTNKIPFKGRDNITIAYAAAKNERPSLENLPEDIVALLQSCWAEDPKVRPEFSEITVTLTKILEKLCPTESIPTDTDVVEVEAEDAVETEDSKSNVQEDSLAANHVRNETDKKRKTDKKSKTEKKKKGRIILNRFLKCLGHCFSF